MRGLRLLVGAIVFVDTMFYAALTPLLPHYAQELGLSKAGAGLIAGAYAVGALAGGIPAAVLASRFGGLSRMRVTNLIVGGACLVNGRTAQAGWRVSAGDRLEFRLDEGAPTAMAPEPLPLEIVYEDDHVIVVVKPAGMLVHPTKNVKGGTLANALTYHLNKEFFAEDSTGAPRG